MATARADTCTAAKPTADQMRVLEILAQLDGAADKEHLTMAKELGDRAGEGGAYGNLELLGCAYYSQGDYAKATSLKGGATQP